MSLESERRANGAALEASRRAGGAAMEASRRAGGAALVAQRRGEQLQRDINSLGVRRVSQRTLRQVQPRGGIPGGMSTAFWSDSTRKASTGGGVAWPLTEQTTTVDGKTVPDREYYPDVVLISSDGIFTYEVPPIKVTKWTDADGARDRKFLHADVPRP